MFVERAPGPRKRIGSDLSTRALRRAALDETGTLESPQGRGQGSRAHAGETTLDRAESDGPVTTEERDDTDGPLLSDYIDKALRGTGAHEVSGAGLGHFVGT